jgi:hypothetical protein
MSTTNHTTLRALRDLGLVAAAAGAAASIWAAGLPEEGYLLDAPMWREEVALNATSGLWPTDGWYRLRLEDKAVDVRAVKPSQPLDAQADTDDALYFRMPGTALKQGARAMYRNAAAIAQPKLGKQYELTLGKTRFGFSVESGAKGMRYDIAYGGETYSYQLGAFDATETRIKAVADLDGDARPDFLIDVGDQTFLLLSTQARPGFNAPTAELWAKGC